MPSATTRRGRRPHWRRGRARARGCTAHRDELFCELHERIVCGSPRAGLRPWLAAGRGARPSFAGTRARAPPPSPPPTATAAPLLPATPSRRGRARRSRTTRAGLSPPGPRPRWPARPAAPAAARRRPRRAGAAPRTQRPARARAAAPRRGRRRWAGGRGGGRHRPARGAASQAPPHPPPGRPSGARSGSRLPPPPSPPSPPAPRGRAACIRVPTGRGLLPSGNPRAVSREKRGARRKIKTKIPPVPQPRRPDRGASCGVGWLVGGGGGGGPGERGGAGRKLGPADVSLTAQPENMSANRPTPAAA